MNPYFTRPDKSATALSTPLLYDAEGVQSEAESVATEDLGRQVIPHGIDHASLEGLGGPGHIGVEARESGSSGIGLAARTLLCSPM